MNCRTPILPVLAILALFPPAFASAQISDSTATIDIQPLRPGDQIRLRIWREPDMSGSFDIDENGVVVFPRVGEYRVLDETPESLKARLVEDYRRYLRNPSIDVTVLRRIRITGAVSNPGLHLVDPTMTVADALAMAGGSTSIGDPNKIHIIRDDLRVDVNIRTDTRLAEARIRSGDQIVVPERSWVSRNAPVVAAAITGTVSLVIALFLR